MKKTLIASAVAAATFSGAALAQEANLPTVYGNIQLAYINSNAGGNSSELFDNGSTLGVKHSHELMPGVEGFFKAELEFDADNKANNNGLSGFDEAYVGVKGDSFGQIWVGSDDSTYESAIDEIANYYEVASQSQGGSYDTGEGDLIQYRTPSFGGLTFGAAVQINGNSDSQNPGGNNYPYQLAAMYEMGGLEVAVAMDSNDGNTSYSSGGSSSTTYTVDSTDPTNVIARTVVTPNGANNENTYGMRVSYSMDDLRLTGQYQTRKDVSDVYGLFAGYTMGSNTFAVSWERTAPDVDGADDIDVYTVQALHNLSDHMYVYVEGYLGQGGDNYAGYTNGQEDQQTDLAVGTTYYF
ncbi:porin [Marinobacter mangrovi]|uniref:porin n=1 Tax=Marinobacter mangrovi TaxID=2803918 RepID=UPI001933D419|nr:porin [Marinobacter mangrovi]